MGLISIIVPVYNEESNIAFFYGEIQAVLRRLGLDYELIFIDDGSTDTTSSLVGTLHASDPRVKLLTFSRNFGHQLALTAGMDYATGDAVIMLDGDLQHPPALIASLIERWKEGHDIVYTVRQTAQNKRSLKALTSWGFYKIYKTLIGFSLPEGAADFRLLDRKVVNALTPLREHGRFLRGMVHWVGFKSIAVPFEESPRRAGRTKYSWMRMIRFGIDAIVSFSLVPLYITILLGLLLALMGFLYGGFALYARLISHQTLPGWTSLIVLGTIIGGIQLTVTGILGLYVAKIFEEAKRRPLYILRQSLGFNADPPRIAPS